MSSISKPTPDFIYNKIKENDGILSLVDIENYFDDIPNDKSFQWYLYFSKEKNLVYWVTRKQEVVDCINGLVKQQKIAFKSCNQIIYLLDGTMLNLPLAKSLRKYKEMHWVPVVLYTLEKAQTLKNVDWHSDKKTVLSALRGVA